MRGTPFLREGWTGGLNTISNPYSVAETESRDCLNVVSTERGAIRKRYGSVEFNKGGSLEGVELTSLAPVIVSSTPYLIASDGPHLYSINGTGEVSTIGEGFTAATRWSVVQAPTSTQISGQGPVYLVNGVDKPQYWTGAAANTKVKEWTGAENSPKPKDGKIEIHTDILKSTEAKFFPSDIGLWVEFAEEQICLGETGTELKIKRAQIEGITPTFEAILALPGENGWKESKGSLEFTLERSFYNKEKHVPNGQYMVFFGNRIWMTGVKADPSAVWFSELVSIGEGGSQADPSQWPSTNVVRFEHSDGYPITGIGLVGPYLCIFKEFKTWVIHDINTGANRRISDKIGCVAHRSIVESSGGTFFLTPDQGVYLTNGSTLHEMSYNVRPTLLGINASNRANAAGAYFNNHYYLSFASGTSTVNNRTVDYDAQLKSWWLHDLAANQWVVWEP